MSKYAFCLLLGVFIAREPLYSQNQHVIDSLKGVIGNSEGVEKYTAWHRLVSEYVNVDNEMALALVSHAEAVALSIGDSISILKSKRLRGHILYHLGKPQSVISLLQPLESSHQLRRNHDEYMAIMNLIGISHVLVSHFDRALACFFLMKDHAAKTHDAHYTAISDSNIGVTYYKLKDYAKALPYMISGYEKEDSLGVVKFGSPMNISLCYSYLGRYDLAWEFLQKSIGLCGNDCDSKGLIHIKYASGSIFYALKEYDKAEAEFRTSLNFSRAVNDYRMELDNIYLLAKINMDKNDLRKAEYYLRSVDPLIEKKVPFNLEAIKVYSELSELYLRLRKFEKAAFYQSRYIALRDSIYHEGLTTNLMKIESGYLQRENEGKIAAQANIIMLKSQIIQHQIIVNWLIAGLAVTVFLLLIFLYKAFFSKAKLNHLLEEKIRIRTMELDAVVQRLSLTIKEKELEIERKSRIQGEVAGAVERICDVGSVEVKDELAQTYLLKIRNCFRRSNGI